MRSHSAEWFVFLIYPVTILIGSWAKWSALLEEPFRHNLVNILFIKKGWGWTTVVYVYLLVQQRGGQQGGVESERIKARQGSQGSQSSQATILKTLVRWGLMTVWWILVTQWCFGPPIMDRGFLLTGGGCVTINEGLDGTSDTGGVLSNRILTSAKCRMAGGDWKGEKAHDLSGKGVKLI